jgi:hypothetical protein
MVRAQRLEFQFSRTPSSMASRERSIVRNARAHATLDANHRDVNTKSRAEVVQITIGFVRFPAGVCEDVSRPDASVT